MNEPNILRCPACGGPVWFGATFCAYCRGPLTWGAVPLLARGALVAHVDAAKEELPRRGNLHAVAEQRVAGGVQITCAALKVVNGELGANRRHGCIVARATALDPASAIGVAARRHPMPGACGYALVIVPYYRVVHLTRYTATTKGAYTDALHEHEFHPSVAGLGQPNEIELRCADSILQIFVNGHQVAACLDAAFGFGAFGWRVESVVAQPSRAIIHSISLFGVA